MLGQHVFAAQRDDDQGEQQTERRRGLDPARGEAALAGPRMLGDVGCGAAIFTAEREALAQPQRHQEDRRQPADRGVGRQQSDQEGRGAHHHDGDQEGIFAPDEIADAAEHQRAERTDQESGRVGRKCRQERGGIVAGREEQRGEERRQNGIEIEVIPFEDGAERRSEDDEFLFARHAGTTCGRVRQCGGHGSLPRELDPSLFPKQNDATTRLRRKRYSAPAIVSVRHWS
jgi:hypothetical protein